MEELVLREDDHGLAILSLNRPDSLNALSPSLFMELKGHIDDIAGQTDEVGAVILCGKGRSFSAGNDLKAIQAGESAPSPYFQAETLDAIEELSQPVIAAVHGHCYTGALELALACDLLIAGESAKFSDTHGRWAMTPIWGMSLRLPRRVGLIRAKEMMFSGRVIDGFEAVQFGLANKCVPDERLMEASVKMARGFLENSWHTLRSDKWLINEGQKRTLKDGLIFERENSPGAGPDSADRVKAFESGRKKK